MSYVDACRQFGLSPMVQPAKRRARTFRDMYDSKSVALAFMEELPNIAAYAYQDVHVWSAL